VKDFIIVNVVVVVVVCLLLLSEFPALSSLSPGGVSKLRKMSQLYFSFMDIDDRRGWLNTPIEGTSYSS